MSVQVSYSKQLLLLILLLVVILLTLEGSLRLFDYFYPTCNFLNSQVYQDTEINLKRKICLDFQEINWNYVPYLHLEPNQHFSTIDINQFGFRGSEVSKNKPPDTFRIFVVGGSTIFGAGASDDETTIPGYLSHFYNSNTELNVEVINAGIPNAYSYTESKYIKDIIIEFEPDLLIVYDGWNDITTDYSNYGKDSNAQSSEQFLYLVLHNDFFKTGKILFQNYLLWLNSDHQINVFDNSNIDDKVLLWQQQWTEICELGNKKGFDIFIILQPLIGSGNKQLTSEELNYYKNFDHEHLLISYEKYGDSLIHLQSQCTKIADFRNVFDGSSFPLYYDSGHVSDRGNRIVAEKMFELTNALIVNNTK